jgi:uncharacterized protein YecE (DUF72 family)
VKGRTQIRVGIGGWSYEPWRKTFYPKNVKKKDELAYAGSKLTAIEVNSTFYRLQKPATFAKWRDATPDGFMFSVKAPRFVTQRKCIRCRRHAALPRPAASRSPWHAVATRSQRAARELHDAPIREARASTRGDHRARRR